MLRSVKSFLGYSLRATDGEIGKVGDVFFDDELWSTAYLVADTGGWLSGRRVLLSPTALGEPSWEKQTLPVALSKDEVKNSPGIDLDKPVSRQREVELHKHYGWTPYWLPGAYALGTAPMVRPLPSPVEESKEADGDPHLRSVDEVMGYHIKATDGDIGHVEDFIIDDATWSVRYLVIDTRNWLPGRKVLISPEWIRKIEWARSYVHIDFTKEIVKGSPEYDPTIPINQEYEERLYDYYGRPAEWVSDLKE